MLTSFVVFFCCFFVTRKYHKIQKVDGNIDGENFLNELRNFNEVLRKDVTLIILKVTKNTWRHAPSIKCIFEKTRREREVKLTHPSFLRVRNNHGED